MATHFLPLSKNVSCTSTPQGKHLCQISWELVKNWGSSSRRKIFPPIFAIICRYHGNTLSNHCQKMCLAHLHPKANICAKFHENWWKTEEVVRDARFSPHFCQYAVTMATIFLPLSKNVSCTSTPQGKHLCPILWELVKNWGSSSRRKMATDRPTARPDWQPTARPTTRWFLYTPLIHYVYAGV